MIGRAWPLAVEMAPLGRRIFHAKRTICITHISSHEMDDVLLFSSLYNLRDHQSLPTTLISQAR